MKVEEVKCLDDSDGDGWEGDVRLVRAEDGRHFVVSGVDLLHSGWEVLVFKADERGATSSCLDIGGRGVTHAQVVAELESYLDEATA